MYLADDNDLGIDPLKLLYDKSIAVKYVFGPNTSGRLPSSPFRLKFTMFKPELESKPAGIGPESRFESRFKVERTGIDPI